MSRYSRVSVLVKPTQSGKTFVMLSTIKAQARRKNIDEGELNKIFQPLNDDEMDIDVNDEDSESTDIQNLQPFESTDIQLVADYNSTNIIQEIQNFQKLDEMDIDVLRNTDPDPLPIRHDDGTVHWQNEPAPTSTNNSPRGENLQPFNDNDDSDDNDAPASTRRQRRKKHGLRS